MSWKTNITVAAILEHRNQFLLVEEMTEHGIRFNQPAGHLEPKESLIDAVIRETLEETGHHFAPKSVTEVHLWAQSETQSFLRFCFCGDFAPQVSNAQLDPDIINTHWLTLDEITSLNSNERLRSPLVLKCIETYLAGQRYPLEILHTL